MHAHHRTASPTRIRENHPQAKTPLRAWYAEASRANWSTPADIKAAQDKVYAIIDKLDTKGMFYRHDIGFKALNA